MDARPGSSLQAASVVNTSWTEDVGLGASGWAQLVLEIVMVLMCLGAVTGNLLVIVIVASTKTLHSVTSVLIMNLAISDLLVGVGVMPFVALSIMDRGWVDHNGLCLYVGYTSSVYCTVSVLTLAAIALDRYHSIMDCLRYSSRCTLWRTCAVVIWIWMQALLTSCPPLLGWGSVSYVVPMYSCAVNWASSPSYTAFMASLSFFIPAGVILFCYVNIVKVAHSHARRIHTLEGSVQRSRIPNTSLSEQCCPCRLIYHLSGEIVSEIRREQGIFINSFLLDSTSQQSNSTPKHFFSFQAHHHNKHGVLRLFLVILAFLLCWTPFVCIAVVQAAEIATSGRSTLVPPSAITFLFLLLLLNSDINPLLYALLSKRFQCALRGLRQKIRACLGVFMDSAGELQTEGEDGKGSNTSTPNSPNPDPRSETLTCDYTSIFTISANFNQHLNEHHRKVCHHENFALSCSTEKDAAADDTRVDYLQVPFRPQGGCRLPFSALTNERQATFLYGQIKVRVEHDVC